MKLKTKKSKISFNEGIKYILESHGLFIDPKLLNPITESLQEYFNNVFKPDDSTPYWSELVTQWVVFYEEITGNKPEFTQIEAINLKRLNKTLKTRYLGRKNGIWDLHTSITQQELYYRSAITISFYKQALSLTNLYSKFNEIVAQLSARNKTQQK